jgi:hypothetical protein
VRRAQETRRTSDWSCDAAVESAARYVTGVRSAAGPRNRLRALADRRGIAAVVTVVRSVPVVEAPFSDGPAGVELRGWFRLGRGLVLGRAPVAVLGLPDTYAEYLRGRPRQALRTNITRATALGVRCAVVDQPEELGRVIAHVARCREQEPASMMREHVEPGLTRRVSVAYDADGSPVAISETVVDGAWAGLATLVTVPTEGDGQLLRYLLHAHTVGDLIEQGVRTVTVSGSMLLTAAGTRYFQRRTGYEPSRLRPVAGATAAPAPVGDGPAPAAVGAARPRRVVVPTPRAAADADVPTVTVQLSEV